MESRGHVRWPKRYRNEFGQLIEGAPYSERDIRRPTQLRTHDEKGDFPILVKQYDGLNEIILDHHPFDVVGWDGYFYPWAFNINDFEPIVGRVHQPPPVHQTFQGDGFVVCSFCPRPYDFHPEAVPAPYNHSNVDSDEVLYYASSEFMSRKGIEFGSITHHPDGIPHGPHPGRAEASIGAKYTEELAVMMDTFRPLKVAKPALADRGPGLPQVVARRAARAVQSAYFVRRHAERAAGCSVSRSSRCRPLWIPTPSASSARISPRSSSTSATRPAGAERSRTSPPFTAGRWSSPRHSGPRSGGSAAWLPRSGRAQSPGTRWSSGSTGWRRRIRSSGPAGSPAPGSTSPRTCSGTPTIARPWYSGTSGAASGRSATAS